MESFTGKAIKSSLPIITNSAGWLVLLLGSATLLAWTLGVQGSIHELPFWVAMGPLTSVSLALFGISLWRLASSEKPDRTGVILAITILVVGLLGLALYYFELPLSTSSNIAHRIFELPPNTAFSLTCCGAALVLCDLQPKKCLRSAQALVLVAGLIALLALIGYGYKVPLYQVGSAKPMALSTAAGLLVFCFGFLAARPDRGLMTVLTS